MTVALKILQEIETNYSIFEKDQVLTERQLNRVTDYLNDQTRLTRIYLLGVGVVFGLRVSEQDDVVQVTKGVGITTDGDLLYYNNETLFDRFLEYDGSYPKYAPFYRDGNLEGEMIPVYELIRQGAEDPRRSIFPLSEFNTRTTKEIGDMVAVLLMESYVNDPDLCTGTDCDNLGKDCINTPRLLLVEKSDINSLEPDIPTPDKAFKALNEIVANRSLIPDSIGSVPELTNIYYSVCKNIHSKLLEELDNLHNTINRSAFLADVFPSDPTNTWITQINNIHNNFSSSDVGIQYYYDFLKDVVETYNKFRELLFGDTTCCCPDINWFPKHLLLGNLVPGDDPDENRTAFYLSPAVSQTTESLNHAKFLARKLDTLIKTFQIPAPSTTAPIRITPSLFEDQPLEERAIPYYYQVNETNPIYKSWNYRRHQQGMDSYNYSYNASLYDAQGGAAKPLESQIGHFSFFRIEGHLGQKLEIAFNAISKIIKSHNLPFSVRAATLGVPTSTEVVNFKDLISQQPSIEHFGGVMRGQTFVLLTDTDNETVIADFMLPDRLVILERLLLLEQLLLPAFAESPNPEFWPPIAQPGIDVILFGSNFTVGTPTVRFGAIEAKVVSATDTWIVATVPEMPASEINITVSNAMSIQGVTSRQKLKVPTPGPLPPLPDIQPTQGIPGDTIFLYFNTDLQKLNTYGVKAIWFSTTKAPQFDVGQQGNWPPYVWVEIPSMPPGGVRLSLQTEHGILTSTDIFTVLAPRYYSYGSGTGIGDGLL